jgi:poly(3-hydroxybutyrate) depolymerase
MRGRWGGAVVAWLCASLAHAAETRVLAASACAAPTPPPLFANDFEDAAAPWSRPSGGGGGAFPGDFQRSVFVPQLGAFRDYLVHLPPQYDPARAWPVVVVLHGAGGAGTAPAAAAAARTAWLLPADTSAFIVLAPIASGASGGWVGSSDTYTIRAALADLEASYNVERSREYLWGFSAGGHFGHGVVLEDTARFAAYGVNAGVLQVYAGNGAPGVAALTRRVPVAMRIGSLDSLLPFAQADRTRFLAAGWTDGEILAYTEFPSGHVYGAADAVATWQFACRFAVVP